MSSGWLVTDHYIKDKAARSNGNGKSVKKKSALMRR